MTWVYLTLMAATLQAIRVAAQKHLSQMLSPGAVTWVRYLYGLPFALSYLLLIKYFFVEPWPAFNMRFWVYVVFGGVAQIVATGLMIHLFSLRNFAVGTTLVKTEAIQVALIGALFFNQSISHVGWFGVVVSVIGVLLLSDIRVAFHMSRDPGFFFNTSALIGLLSGCLFALTSLSVREASLALAHNNLFFTASFTLASMIILQTVINGVYLLYREPRQIHLTVKHWRPALFVGITSLVGSVGWFTAMTLQFPAFVKALGQIEFIFAVLISIRFFKEIPKPIEVAGMVLIIMGVIVMLILA